MWQYRYFRRSEDCVVQISSIFFVENINSIAKIRPLRKTSENGLTKHQHDFPHSHSTLQNTITLQYPNIFTTISLAVYRIITDITHSSIISSEASTEHTYKTPHKHKQAHRRRFVRCTFQKQTDGVVTSDLLSPLSLISLSGI